MHILVIGAGVTGVTTAWYLRQAGYNVTVVERRAAPALETSFANGGQISLSHPEPWANPSAPAILLRGLAHEDAPMLFRLPPELSRIRWGLNFLRECLPWRTRRSTAAIAALAAYSGRQLKQLRAETHIEYHQLSLGILHLYFDATQRRHGRQQSAMLNRYGILNNLATPDECIAAEPALAHIAPRLTGGLIGLNDESGDAYLFTTRLAQLAQQEGVRFIFNAEIMHLERSKKHIRMAHIRDNEGRTGGLAADAYILAAGCHSKLLMKRLRKRLPLYPVKGYSATLKIIDPRRAPTMSVTDEARRIVCSRLDDHLRVAGTAELAGYDLTLRPERCQPLLRWVEQTFPGACDLNAPQFWAGLRPTTPSNVPIIGRSPYANLFYNTGHGTLGWTLACGSAKALADIVCGRPPEPDFPFLE